MGAFVFVFVHVYMSIHVHTLFSKSTELTGHTQTLHGKDNGRATPNAKFLVVL